MSTPTQTPEADFRRLYERTSPRVFGYVRRYCCDGDCDDVIAEVYLVAWRRFADLPADVVPWLLGTARRVLANHWRSRDRRERLTVELRGLHRVAGADCASEVVERSDMLAALGRLSPDDREILLLSGWDGLDPAAIAKVVGCSVVAARARLRRARGRLQAGFEPSRADGVRLFPLTEGN